MKFTNIVTKKCAVVFVTVTLLFGQFAYADDAPIGSSTQTKSLLRQYHQYFQAGVSLQAPGK